MLGVAFDANDGHVRISQGKNYDVFMGSSESHEYILNMLRRIEEKLDKEGILLEDLDPLRFSDFIQSID